MGQYTSYYLYQKFEHREGNADYWIPVYPNTFSVDADGTQPKVVKIENDAECGYVPPYEPVYRWTVLTPTIDPNSYYCDNCPIYQWVDITPSSSDPSSYMCDNCVRYRWAKAPVTDYYCDNTTHVKYYKEYYQVSYDDGITWQNATPFSSRTTNDVIEYNSIDCGYVPVQYRWENMNISTDYYCDNENHIKYYKQEREISYDGGETWSAVSPAETKKGAAYEGMSVDCGYIVDYNTQPLTIRTTDECTLRFSNTPMSYSTDKGLTWESFRAGVDYTFPSGSMIMFKGNLTTPSQLTGIGVFTTTGRFTVEGNIMSLQYGDNFVGQKNLSYSFAGLFSGNTGLTSAQNLILPASGLTTYAYMDMFHGCTHLITPPSELPAETLSDSCYKNMFYGCSALSDTPYTFGEPYIHGRTLANYCYQGMFQGCTSLTGMRQGKYADSYATSCFDRMYAGCTSLSSVTFNLNSTANTTASYAFYAMFSGCTSLSSATLNGLNGIANNNVYQMFDGCSNLSYVKCLATYIDSGSSYCWLRGVAATGTFSKASSGTTWVSGESGIPYGWTVTYPIYRWVDTTATTCYNCNKYYVSREEVSYDEGQTWIPTSRTFYGSLIEENSYDCGYRERWINSGTTCSDGDLYNVEIKQESKDSGQTWTTTTEMRQGSLIESGSSECSFDDKYLTFVALENGTFKFTGNAVSYSLDSGNTWNSLASGTNSPTVPIGGKIMWKATLSNSSGIIGKFSSSGRFNIEGNAMSLLHGDNFSGQTSLSGYGLRYLFSGCTTVVSAKNLSLPATSFTNNYCYSRMFEGCTSLTTAPNILPSMSLKPYCYEYMFQNCTSLTTAPVLPATALTNNCYDHMFYGCESLNYIKCLATFLFSGSTNYWVYGVSSSGTFVKDANTTWSTGVSGIPSGWTVENA